MWRKTIRQCILGWSSLIFIKTFSIIRNTLVLKKICPYTFLCIPNSFKWNSQHFLCTSFVYFEKVNASWVQTFFYVLCWSTPLCKWTIARVNISPWYQSTNYKSIISSQAIRKPHGLWQSTYMRTRRKRQNNRTNEMSYIYWYEILPCTASIVK